MSSLALVAPLIAACFGEVASAACSPAAVGVATQPHPYQVASQRSRMDDILKTSPTAADVVIIGDSIGQALPNDLAAQRLPGKKIWNIAVSGSFTQNVIWQLDALPPDALRPKLILTIVGTNNLNSAEVPACAALAGIESVLSKASARWPTATVAILGILPRGYAFQFRDLDRKSINRRLQAWVETQANMKYVAVDDQAFTCGHYGDTTAVPSRTPTHAVPCLNYIWDLKHISRAGYAQILDSLATTR